MEIRLTNKEVALMLNKPVTWIHNNIFKLKLQTPGPGLLSVPNVYELFKQAFLTTGYEDINYKALVTKDILTKNIATLEEATNNFDVYRFALVAKYKNPKLTMSNHLMRITRKAGINTRIKRDFVKYLFTIYGGLILDKGEKQLSKLLHKMPKCLCSKELTALLYKELIQDITI